MLERKVIETEDSLFKLIEDEGLEVEIESSRFPIRAKISNSMELKNQLSMVGGSNHHGGYIEFVFENELVMLVENFKIEDGLLSKIKNRLKKWHYAYLELYFEKKTGGTNGV